MIKYRQFIEENFLIDNAKTGRLQPFAFNEVQEHYYADLVREYDIERKGINVAIREDILKARREGFSSFILGLFAADDLNQENPTESDVLSYKDDATETFRKRYRTYLLSFFLKEQGITAEQIADNVNLLEEIAPLVLSVDSTDIEIKHNKAHFQCNTASARVGGRGGVRHKILFSENAFYPDTPKLKASEMIEATSQQVDPDSGWIFMESTENGVGTYQHRKWTDSQKGRSNYRNRFYGAGEFYTAERIETIKSGYVDMDAFRRDYPMTEDDLFKGGTKSFTTEALIEALVMNEARKQLLHWTNTFGENYLDQCELILGELQMLERANPGRDLYVGLDTAKALDGTVSTVLKDTNQSLSGGGVKAIAIDVTNGDFVADWFEKNTGYYVIKVHFSRPSKSLMFTNLQVVIANEATSLPVLKEGKEYVSDEAARFDAQMMSLEKELKGDLLVVAHPSGNCDRNDHNYDECPYHDDFPDSWCLAEHAWVDINGVPKLKKKPAVPTVPNAIEHLLRSPGSSLRKRGGTNGFSE